MLLANVDGGLLLIGRFSPLWVGGGDEPDFAVQNPQQIFELLGMTAVAGGFQEFLIRTHVAFDVSAGFRQESLERRTSRFLVQTMLGRCGRGAERLFKERDSHALGAADLNERG